MIIFIRRVKYYLHLKYRLFLDKRGITTIKTTQESEIKQWKKALIEKSSIIDSSRIENDKSIISLETIKILDHQFHILGKDYFNKPLFTEKELTYKPINWHIDPSSGYVFPKNCWYRDVRKNIPIGVDIKHPWELSRCQHFILLGEAYNISKDDKYAFEYRNQILDWIEQNPIRYGVNWSCTMEVGIRISNWLVALLYFIDSRAIDDTFLDTLFTSALEHGNHIKKNLENLQPYTSNHYVANIAGLFVLAALIPKSRKKRQWLNFASKELEKEIEKQTYKSGWQYEASTSYHRLVTEMFFYPFIIAKELEIHFSKNYSLRLKSMISILERISKPNGCIPQIGDNDSGRFLIFNYEESNDDLNVQYLLKTAKNYKGLNVENPMDFPILNFDAGRFLWKDKRIYFLLIAGPKGQGGNGGHAHNDVLSYVLNVNGREVFVDPGTYAYTRNPEDRNFFRSVKNHNTLHWDNLEPCTFDNGLFTLREEGLLEVGVDGGDELQPVVTGLYSYANRWHKRSISVDFINRIINISDKCSQPGGILSFVLVPGMKFRINNNRIENDLVKVTFDRVESIQQELGFYSSGYGKREETNIIRVKLKTTYCSHTISY